MNRPIRNLSVACMVLFVALLINATYPMKSRGRLAALAWTTIPRGPR